VASILREGLRPGARHDVHLSERLDTAAAVGRRHGELVLLAVRAGDMRRAGHVFRRTPNGVWLVAAVPPEYVSRAEDKHGNDQGPMSNQ
jgi:putative RNA 2'-phosphotransferase